MAYYNYRDVDDANYAYYKSAYYSNSRCCPNGQTNNYPCQWPCQWVPVCCVPGPIGPIGPTGPTEQTI